MSTPYKPTTAQIIALDKWEARVKDTPNAWFDAPLVAVSKERPRTGKSGHMYTPKKTQDFERAIASWYKKSGNKIFTHALEVTINIKTVIPESWHSTKRLLALRGLLLPTRGDLDNQIKAITDGLNGVAYLDDVQINRIIAVRTYGTKSNIHVMIQPIGLSSQEVEQALYTLKAAHNDQRKTYKGRA